MKTVITIPEDPITAELDARADEWGGTAAPAVGRALIDSGAWEWSSD